jgi:CRISPR-associated endonuclease/helicase Cas3
MLRCLWAKKSKEANNQDFLPLISHLSDTAEATARLYDIWIPENLKHFISRKLLIFLSAAHDVGKATPVFQIKPSRSGNKELDETLLSALTRAGFPVESKYIDAQKTRHELASHMVLRRFGINESLCIVLSGHHGKPPNSGQLKDLKGKAYDNHLGFNNEQWMNAQNFLFNYALECAGFSLDEARVLRLTRAEQVIFSGLIIFSDWIASDETLFPLVDVDSNTPIDSALRAEYAFEKLNLPFLWKADADEFNIFSQRFEIDYDNVRPVQAAAARIAGMSPGIMIIEAPMGEGKTEAALAAAEIIAAKRGLRGVYFALPTQATSNAMFERVIRWIKTFGENMEEYSVMLSHGKAELNKTFRNFRLSSGVETDGGEENNAFVHEWFVGRKKGILADFAVGTIDHVLMMGLKQKHLALRHLGLAGKVVVLDEVHASDLFMESYLHKALAWLGAYGVPVVALSATLPAERRNELINAYTGKVNEPVKSSAYPLITYVCGEQTEYEEIQRSDEKRSREVRLNRINDEELADKISEALSGGGCAGVIVNTVKRAQEKYRELAARFGEECVYLLHARLLACDRAKLEEKLAGMLGPPKKEEGKGEFGLPGKEDNEGKFGLTGRAENKGKFSLADTPEKTGRPEKLIVIGTQVMEQSLDYDFDVLFSDLCPVDLLLQRIGRLHRHTRERPQNLENAVCNVLCANEEKLEPGAEAVYGSYILLRTRALLREIESVCLPGDIPKLVASVYSEESGDEFAEQREAYTAKNEIRKAAAGSFQIGKPATEKSTLIGWLDTSLSDDSEKRGEAAVRDGADSIEVIVIQRLKDGFHLLGWIEKGQTIPVGVPGNNLAIKIAECSVRLPALYGGKWIINDAIKELEEAMSKHYLNITWYASPLLKGSLCLILNENMEATLCGYTIRYDKILGLQHEKEEKQ